jgi:endonuclease/exonuclease/phosphatase family metal-dependent hydrolase
MNPKVILSAIIATLFVMMISCSDSQTQNRADTKQEVSNNLIRVMTFNIRYDNPGDGENAWFNRKEFVASTIRLHQADVVGVQEALLHQLEDLSEQLPEFSWTGTGRNADGGGEYSAILYRTDRFEMIETDTFWLSESPDVPGSRSWDAAYPRIATWARLSDKKSNDEVVVLNTHFDHIGELARVESAKQILDTVPKIAEGLPIVVMGDLNTTENGEPYTVLAESTLSDGRKLLDGFYHSVHGHHGPSSTWTGFTNIVPDRRIDYIFVSDDITVNQHAALADQSDGLFPSDHLPVLAEIELP